MTAPYVHTCPECGRYSAPVPAAPLIWKCGVCGYVDFMAAAGPNAELGFAGLVMAGEDPAEVHARIRRAARTPLIERIISVMANTADGRAALERSRRLWKARGFAPPWEPDVAE